MDGKSAIEHPAKAREVMNEYPALLESSRCDREAKQRTLVGLKEFVVTVVWWECEEYSRLHESTTKA